MRFRIKMKWKELFTRIVNKTIQALDHYKIKKKFYFTYLFCVLVPVIVTNTLVLSIIFEWENQKHIQQSESIIEAVEYQMSNMVKESLDITKDIYTNKVISNFMDRQYESPLAYFTAFKNMNLNYYIKAATTSSLKGIMLYADNPTIINGSEFARIEGAADTKWYQEYKEAGKDFLIVNYYDNDKSYSYYSGNRRKIYLIRKLNFYNKSGCEKFIRIELNYNNVMKDMAGNNYGAQVYICDGNTIIFDNTENIYTDVQFQKLNPEIKEKANKKHTIYVYDKKWDIYVVAYKTDIMQLLERFWWIIPLLMVINMAVPIFVIYCVNSSITDRLLLLGRYLDKVKAEQFEELRLERKQDEVGGLVENYNLMVVKIKDLIEVVYKNKLEQQELRLAKQQAELLALHSQINPHFMFNSLESIRMRSVIKKETETAEIIAQLAILLRKSINWGDDSICIQEEIEFVEAYLQLQKYRFGERLSYRVTVAENCKNITIPKLTIVSLVENACVHGIEGMSRSGWVMVNVEKKAENLIIEVEDTGIGMSENRIEYLLRVMNKPSIELLEKSKSIGMINVCLRLKNFFDCKIKYEIESEENVGTMICVMIPLI